MRALWGWARGITAVLVAAATLGLPGACGVSLKLDTESGLGQRNADSIRLLRVSSAESAATATAMGVGNTRFQIDYDVLIDGVNVRVLIATRNCTTLLKSVTADAGAQKNADPARLMMLPQSAGEFDSTGELAVGWQCTNLTFPLLQTYFPQILDATRRFEDAVCFCLVEQRDMVCSCDKVQLGAKNETVDFGTELYGTCEKQCSGASSRPATYNRCFVDCKHGMARTYRELLEQQYENGRAQLRNITLVLAFAPPETFSNASQYAGLRGSVRALEASTAAKSLDLEKAIDAEVCVRVRTWVRLALSRLLARVTLPARPCCSHCCRL
jgi:hypothetical protein